MASLSYKKLQSLQKKEEALRQRLKDLETERKAIIGPMRTRMINAADRAITKAIQDHIDAALSSTVSSEKFEESVYNTALSFFDIEKTSESEEETVPLDLDEEI